jgi:uncharacterized protein (DUF58 family)
LLFAVGTNVQAGWVLVIAALLLGLLVAGVVIPLSSLRGIRIARRTPRTATAGDPVPVTIEVTNDGQRMRGLFRVNDDFCGPGWAVVGMVQGHGTRSYVSDRTEARRGVYESGVAVLESGMPFGVLRVRRPRVIDSPLVVYPKVYEVPERIATGASTWFAPAAVGDVSSVREYRPGDPLRHIHWRSVARHGQLMVREFDREHNADAAVVAVVGEAPDIADAVATVACSLALSALRSGTLTLIGSAEDGPRVVVARSTEGVLDWGARLAAGSAGFDDAIGAAAQARAVIVVAPAEARSLDAIVRASSRQSVQAVFVAAEGAGTSRAVDAVRAAGVPVQTLAPSEIQPWFASGCPLN